MPSSRRARPPLVQVDTPLGKGLDATEIGRRLRRMMTSLHLYDAELSVLLTGDDQMRELNRVYRKKDRTTDVLAFPMSEASGRGFGKGLLGDLVVSVPVARSQASAAGHSPLQEVTTLLAHGLLHLVGWDHDTPRRDRAMRAETERLCAKAAGAKRRARHKLS